MSRGKPISPSDVEKLKHKTMPPAVIDIFNDLIASSYLNGVAFVRQGDVVKKILYSIPGVEVKDIWDNGWLNVEDLFRKAGWAVEYDKPGFNESYEATFKFSRPRGWCG